MELQDIIVSNAGTRDFDPCDQSKKDIEFRSLVGRVFCVDD